MKSHHHESDARYIHFDFRNEFKESETESENESREIDDAGQVKWISWMSHLNLHAVTYSDFRLVNTYLHSLVNIVLIHVLIC